MIEPFHKKLGVSRLCEIAEFTEIKLLPKGRQIGETEYNLELMRLLDEAYTRHTFFGSRKLHKYLNEMGYKVNRKRVQRLMKLMGIQAEACA